MDQAASELAKKRWQKATAKEREEVGRMLSEARAKMSDEERKAIGQRLAAARKKARKKKATKS